MTSFEGLFLIAHVLAILGFITLEVTGNIGALVLIISLIATALSLYGHYSKRDIHLHSGYSTSLSFVVVSYLVASYILMDTDLFVILIHFLVFVQIVKLSGKKEITDYRQIILLSFFQFLSVSVSTTELYYGVVALVILVLTTAGIMLYNICSESHEINENDDEIVVRKSFLKILIPAFLLTLIFTSIIFTSMPRFRKSFITASMIKSNEIRSGYSDEINLGRVGEIKKDNTPVMSVKILSDGIGEPIKNIYWRGATLNEFDGRSWRTGNNTKNIRYENSDGIVLLSDEKREDLVKQEIITEPIDTDVLFAADTPVAYKNVPFNRLKEQNDTQYIYGSVASKKKYIAYSELRKNGQVKIKDNEKDYPKDVVKSNLKNIYTSKVIKDISLQLYEPSLNNYQNVLKVMRYLNENFDYTRTLENTVPAFPLEDFLTKQKKGHCEYFATSMVVMLQNMGIPARLVTGFLGGDYNEKGDFYIVRENHAHAWVEVYFNSDGWVRFDPTPEGDYETEDQSYIYSYIEFMRYRWNRYVVDYDSSDQKVLIDRLKNNIDRSVFNFYQFREYSKNNLTGLVGFAAIIIILYPGYILINRYKMFFSRADNNQTSEIYIKALDIIQSKGFEKKPFLTHREFSAFLNSNNHPDSNSFSVLTDLYLENRYSPHPDDKKINQMKKIIEEMKKTSDKKNISIL